MILPRTPATTIALSALVAAAMAVPAARAGDAMEGAPIQAATSRCAAFGSGAVDMNGVNMGGGLCAPADNHVRVGFGARRAANAPWGAGGTASAELRSEGTEIVPGVGTSRQLRVRSGLQSFDRY